MAQAPQPNPSGRPTPPVSADAAVRMYRDAYEEGKRLVERQVSELDAMRQRAVQFLAFVGSATGFMLGASLTATAARASQGSETARDVWFYGFSAAATLATASTVAALVMLLSGYVFNRGVRKVIWVFRLSPRTLVEGWISPDVGNKAEPRFYRDLALEYGVMGERNEAQLQRVRFVYRLFLGLAISQLTLWGIALWVYG